MAEGAEDEKHAPEEEKEFADAPALEPRREVGLVNEGATGYVNAVIQCLFHIPLFREEILRLKSGCGKSSASASAAAEPTHVSGKPSETRLFISALQRLFESMKDETRSGRLVACSTAELLQSLGFSKSDTLVEGDCGEFLTRLLEKISIAAEECGGSALVRNLFEGQWRVEVTRSNGRVSRKTEAFRTVPLIVKGSFRWMRSYGHTPMNIFHSLAEFLEITRRRRCHFGHAIQFIKVPPIICFELKRSRFRRGQVEKYNDIVRFHKNSFDLNQFVWLSPTEGGEILQDNWNLVYTHYPKTGPWHYTLHSVLVHSGKGADTGHYYAVVNCDGKLVRFDDESVEDAEDQTGKPLWGGKHAVADETATVLIYMLNSRRTQLLTPSRTDRMCDASLTEDTVADSEVAETKDTVQQWFEEHLPPRFCEYLASLKASGYDSLEMLPFVTLEDLKTCGIPVGHCRFLLSKIHSLLAAGGTHE